jgi:hypothetical protein
MEKVKNLLFAGVIQFQCLGMSDILV